MSLRLKKMDSAFRQDDGTFAFKLMDFDVILPQCQSKKVER